MPNPNVKIAAALDELLLEIGSAKTSKQAAAEAGSVSVPGDGPTSKALSDLDNSGSAAEAGPHAKTNAEEIKKDQPGGGVDAAKPDSGAGKGNPESNMAPVLGVAAGTVGEVSGVGDNYTTTAKDPGTTLNEVTTTGSTVDKKGAANPYRGKPVAELCKLASQKINQVTANLIAALRDPGTIAIVPESTKTADAAAVTPTPDATSAAEPTNNLQNQDLIKNAIADSLACADQVAHRIATRLLTMSKKAAEESAASPEPKKDPKEEPSDAPPSEAPPSIPPAAAGPPGGGMPGAEPDEASIHELLAALAEAGITVDQLIAMLQGGGGEGGMPPGGGMPPTGAPGAAPMPPPMPSGGPPGGPAGPEQGMMVAASLDPNKRSQLLKIAQAGKKIQRAGKFQMTEAKNANVRAMRDRAKTVIREICGIS